MIAVIGAFRLPSERIAEALPLMQEVIRETLKESGCRAYSYAQDMSEPGLFRVMGIWDSRETLEAHFRTSHMARWGAARDALGFSDREISVFPLGVGEEI